MISIIYSGYGDVGVLNSSIQSVVSNLYDICNVEFICGGCIDVDTNIFGGCKYFIYETEDIVKLIDKSNCEWFWIMNERRRIKTKYFDKIFDYYDTGIILPFGCDDIHDGIINRSVYNKFNNEVSNELIFKENYLRYDV